MEKKLRIAMLGHKRIPSREGGIEIVVEKLATHMVQKGYEVTCYNRGGHHVSGSQFDADKILSTYKGVKLKTVWTIDKKGIAAMTSSLCATILATFSPYDVIHFHAEGPCVALWLPKIFGKTCVVTIHGIDWKRAKWKGLASKYIKFGEKIAVRHADEIIVLSQNVQQYFWDTYKRKTVFIPNGVDKPVLRNPRLIKEQFMLEKNSYILFLGRLVPEKGIQYLINAFKKVNTEKKLVIAGGSSDTDEYLLELKKLANSDRRIIFTGFVQGQVLDELYSNAYLYTLPSDLEGMPLSLLEAMSYGNCCLTSDIAECVEVVGDHAVTFQKSNAVDLQEKLQMLCDNVEIVSQYKSKAQEYILNKYDWDAVVEKTLELYRRSNDDKKKRKS